MMTYPAPVTARAMAQATGISSHFEGLRLVAYPDPGTGGAPWTIGRGTTEIFGRPVRPGDTCTEAEADAWQALDLSHSLAVVIAALSVQLNGDQLGALASFVNNVGPGRVGVRDGFVWLASGEHSTMFKLIEAGDVAGAAEQFPLWNKAGGRPMVGLTRRRNVERAVFLGNLDVTGSVA